MQAKRQTIQRRLILAAMRELDCHATAEQVYRHVVKDNPAVSKATVYRNLGQMAEAGELLNIGTLQGSTHYDHNVCNHQHFICRDCGSVFDILQPFPALESPLPELDGFTITSRTVTFSGICAHCSEPVSQN